MQKTSLVQKQLENNKSSTYFPTIDLSTRGNSIAHQVHKNIESLF